MKNKLLNIFLLILLSSCAVKQHKPLNIDENGYAAKGHDVVSYFKQNKPIKGNLKYSYNYNGGIYLFSSAANKKTFIANPKKYEPQYGGFCAYGVTQEAKYDIDPKAFKVHNDKLYLNLSLPTQRIWNQKPDDYIETADEIWPNIRNK